MTVWVVHPVREDLSPALEFGVIKYITTSYIYPDEMTIMTPVSKDAPSWFLLPKHVLEKSAAALAAFNPETDYLLIAGDHLQLLQFTAMLARTLPNGFKVLRYDREAPGYLPIHIQPEG